MSVFWTVWEAAARGAELDVVEDKLLAVAAAQRELRFQSSREECFGRLRGGFCVYFENDRNWQQLGGFS